MKFPFRNPSPSLFLGRLLLGLLACALIFVPARAGAQTDQDQQTRGKRSGFLPQNGTQQGTEFTGVPIEVGHIGKDAYDAVIKSGRYIVGPGDVFTVVVDNGDEPQVTEVPVSAEGKLVIPTVGAISVAGLPLSRAHQAIRQAIQNRFRHLNIDVTLTRLRSFPVNVVGEVKDPGAYMVDGVEQVSELIDDAGGLEKPPAGRPSHRNIQILRMENGVPVPTGRRADLALWRITGDTAYNPFVLDGDQIYVPARTDSVSISGAVHMPGNYEFVPGDRVSDLIQLSGGIDGNPETATAELLRISRTQNTQRRISLDLPGILKGKPEANLTLQPYDKVYIQGLDERVTVEGEVYFPGSYPIQEGKTTLRDIVRAAGGFTPQASLAQASLIRNVDNGTSSDDVHQLQARAASLTEDQRAYIAMRAQQVRGRLPVDFSALFQGDDTSQNVLLKDGDVIQVPRIVMSVHVNGFVVVPGSIPYDSTYTARDYIDRAGGFNGQAKKGDVYVIRASTGNWTRASEAKQINPGDTIFVPGKTPVHGWQIFRETLVVLTQVATLVIAVRSVTR